MRFFGIQKALLFFFLAIAGMSSADSFIFDMGGVLVDTNKMASFKEMGIKDVLYYSLILRKNPKKLKNKLFETLNQSAIRNHLNPRKHNTCVKDDEGIALPDIMCSWLKGTRTCTELREIVKREIERHPEWFCHPAEQRLISNLAILMFSPKTFVKTRKILPEGVAFVKQCKAEGHKIYLLSNWDPESFELMKETYPELFELFDGTVISGEVKSLKPYKKIYNYLIKKYQLNHRDCWFIDDQKENIDAAFKQKICGLWCPKRKTLFGEKPDFNYVINLHKQAQQAKQNALKNRLHQVRLP